MCFRFYFPVKNTEFFLLFVESSLISFGSETFLMHFQIAIKAKAYSFLITLLVVASNRKHNSFSTAFKLTTNN